MDQAIVIHPVFPSGRRIIAVSDIHGNLPFFTALMEKIWLTPEDILILLGDMLEKGRVVLGNVALSERELFKLSIEFLEKEGQTPDERCLLKLSHHWVPITDNTLEMGRLLDSLE